MNKKFFSFIFIIFILSFTLTTIIYSFPLKKLKKGDKIDILKLQPINKNGKKLVGNKRKIIFVWRYDKRLSKKNAKYFIKVCKERDISCISVEMKNAPENVILEILGEDISENFYFAKNPHIAKRWGIFTLPVTIFLDDNNKILHAIGYEGQYVVKVERFLDFLEGKITKKELEKLSSSPVNRKISILPDLNYILRLIKENQIEDANNKLEEIKDKLKFDKLNEFEKVKYGYVLIKLKKSELALKVLKSTNSNDLKSQFYQAIALFTLKKFDDALKMLKKIEPLYPDKKGIYFYMGEIYKVKGDYRNAAEFFEKAFNLLDIDF